MQELWGKRVSQKKYNIKFIWRSTTKYQRDFEKTWN